jgi:hypothetical protein
VVCGFTNALLALLFLMFNSQVMLTAILVGLMAAVLLETINYIEHYGLSRIKTRMVAPNVFQKYILGIQTTF